MLQGFKSPSTTRLPFALSALNAAASRRRLRRPWQKWVALAALAAGLLISPARASIQLSDGLPFSDIDFSSTRAQLSPDGQYAVYRQDAVIDGAGELWSVPVSGGVPERLSAALNAGQFLTFAISPDSQYVVYTVDQDTPGRTELFSVPIGGGVITKLNPNLAAGRNVINFQISPTSNRVFYVADRGPATNNDNEFRLYSVPIDGGTSVQLNADLQFDWDVEAYRVSPDGSTVVYRPKWTALGWAQLWSVPALGPAEVAVIINRSLDPGAIVENDFQISPDGNRVIYRADATNPGSYDLYSVLIGGGTSTKINGTQPASSYVDTGFQISPDSTRVVYRSDQSATGVWQIYSVPIAGGTPLQLNGTLGSGEDVEPGFQISPNSSKVVYRSDEDEDGVIDLYSVPLADGAVTKLNPVPVTGGDVQPSFAISPNSTRVVYISDHAVDTVNQLYSVPIGGGTSTRLNRTLGSGGNVVNFRISPDSAWVAYGADQDTNDLFELLATPIGGGTVQDISGVLVSGGDVVLTALQLTAWEFSSNSLDIVYAADEDTDELVDLYASSIAGAPSPPGVPSAVAGNAQATVSFTPPTSDGGTPVTGFTVISSPAGGLDTNAGTTGLTHLVTGLVNGTAYTFTVTATNVLGTSSPSAPSNSVTPATVPGAPTGVVAIPRERSADVAFAAPASNGGNAITGYTVVSNPPGGVDLEQGSLSLNHLVTGLTNNIGYTFTVVALNGVGPSLASAPSAAVVPGCDSLVSTNVFCDGVESSDTGSWSLTATPPGAPTGAAATAGITTVTVTFAAPIDPGGSAISGYTVTSLPAGGVDSDAGSTGLSHVITGLTGGTAYTFTVTAANSYGTGPSSVASNSVTLPTVPGAPTAVVAAASNAQATVTFVAPASDGGSPITGYTVISDPPGGIDGDAGTTGLVHTVTGLVNGTPYTFTVTAINLVGTSAASKASNSVTPATVPGAPSAPVAVGGDSSAIVTLVPPVSDGGSPITGYTVISDPAGGIDGNAGTTALVHSITGLTNGTPYTFTVTATNSVGAGAASAASNIVTPNPPN